MGGTPVTPHVERLIAETPMGGVLGIEQIRRELGLTKEQVQASMYRLSRAEEPAVEVLSRGYLWRVLKGTPVDPTPAGPAFTVAEDLGNAKLLRDDHGTLWLAKRVGVAE